MGVGGLLPFERTCQAASMAAGVADGDGLCWRVSRTSDSSFSVTTIHLLSCWMNLVTGSSRLTLPSSTSIMIEAPTNILDMEAIQKTLSSLIGFFLDVGITELVLLVHLAGLVSHDTDDSGQLVLVL